MTATLHPQPLLDDDGLLRVGTRWIPIPDTQLAIVGRLLSEPTRVLRYDEIARSYSDAGGTDRRPAVSSMLNRLARRMRAVGLDLVFIRSRGVMLGCRISPVPDGRPAG